jgi:hypothetical protein
VRKLRFLRRIENAFKRGTNVVHFTIGFTVGIVNIFGFIGSIISAFSTAVFIIYQTGEDEPRIDSYINMLEFALGFIFSIPFLFMVMVW